MGKKLEMRKSAAQLIKLDKSGRIDARSELGSIITKEDWLQKPDTKLCCPCDQLKDSEKLIPSHLVITDQYLYILRGTDQPGKFVVKARRKLDTIMKITTKAKMSDMIKLQYGVKGADGNILITNQDRFHVPEKSGLVIRTIKKILRPHSGSMSPVTRESTNQLQSPVSSYHSKSCANLTEISQQPKDPKFPAQKSALAFLVVNTLPLRRHSLEGGMPINVKDPLQLPK